MRMIRKGYLQVSKIHKLYYELRGKRGGIPAVSLHGGPGASFKPSHLRRFPDDHCVLFFDQRGCGRSKPLGELKENTTQELVEDIVKLMDHVGFRKAKIVGASWGSTLALCFAIKHPERVTKLVIGGIFLGTDEEQDRITRNQELFSPEIYEKIHSKKQSVRDLHWIEHTIMDNDLTWKEVKPAKVTKSSWIYPYYAAHKYFLPPNYIMRSMQRIAHIPAVIVQGQQDLVCPPVMAWRLSKRFKRCKFILLPGGHKMKNAYLSYRKNM